MKLKNYGLLGCIMFVLVAFPFYSKGQTTNCSTHDYSNGNYSITFNVENTSGTDIFLTGINTAMFGGAGGTYNFTLLYNTTAINSSGGTWTQGTIGQGQNGWQLGGSATATLPSHTSPQPIINGLSILIPTGATYGFALINNSAVEIGYQTISTGTVNSFGTGVVLKTGDNISWGGPVYPGTPSNYPRGWDGCIVWESAVPCSGMPSGGTISAPASVCPSANLTINSVGAGGGANMAYQWQSSPNGFTWSNVAGQTTNTFSGTQAVATNYRLRVICLNGPDTAYSNAVFVDVNPFLTCYCTSASYYTGDEDIVLVEVGSLSNPSVANCDVFTDFTSVTPPNLLKGVGYPVRVDVGDCSPPYYYDHGVAVFIDYNHNGSFNDPGERIFANPIQPNAAVVTHSGNFVVPSTALTGITRMRVIAAEGWDGIDIDPCGTSYNYGETEDYYVNIVPPPADEAGVLAITRPEVAACTLGSEFWVSLQNLGSNTLTSVNYEVKVNGINIPISNPVSVNIPPSSAAEVLIPTNYSLADGDSISVEVSMPNGQVEDTLFSFNNVVGRRVYAGLSGVKSVYGADYANIDDAIEDLALRGVCDTVYFQIASNTYTTQHVFPEYPAAGPGKLAVFESATGNASDVTYAFSASSSADNFTFSFDGADGYMVRNMTLQATGSTYSKVVTFANAPNNVIIENNLILGDTAAAYNLYDFERINIAGYDNTNPTNITIRNNTVKGGNRSMDLEGSLTGYAANFTIEGNTFENFKAICVLLANTSNPVFNNNSIRPSANTSDDVYGYYLIRSIDAGAVSGNDFQTESSGISVFLSDVKGGTENFWVSNNFIYSGDSSSNATYGIYIEDVNSSDIVLANNSISFANDFASSAAISLVDGSQIRMYSNNIGAFGAAPALRIEKSYSLSEANNNNYFGSSLVYRLGTVYTTLASLQSGTGMESNSVSANPGFNAMDLHTCAPALNGTGWPLAEIGFDFDGDARGLLPDIGADEFMGDANSLLGEDEFSKCPDDEVTLGGVPVNGVTYSWAPSGSSSEITVTAAGTYIVSASSVCGTYSDTAIVTNLPLPTANYTSVSVGLSAIFTNGSSNGSNYLWDFGDGTTSTAENPTHVYAMAGTYSVSLTVTNDCGSVTYGPNAVNVINAGVVDNTVSDVRMFPNPTNGTFSITMNGFGSSETTIQVIDVTGKIVLVKNMAAGVNQITLDATNFAAGIYSVKVSNGELSKVMRLVRK